MKKTITLLFIFISTFAYSSNSEILIIEQDTFHLEKSLSTNVYSPHFNCFPSTYDKTIVWKIKDSKLYLDTSDAPIFAKWINDTISVEYGKPVALLRMGHAIANYVNYFEYGMQLVIENGEVASLCKYQNEKNEKGISFFNKNLMDTIVKALNNSIHWDSLIFNCPERTWVEDIFVLKIFKDGNIDIRIYDEEAIKNGDYSCDGCKELFVRKKEINRILSSLKFQRIKRHNKIIDCEMIFDIRYDFPSKNILNPYKIKY